MIESDDDLAAFFDPADFGTAATYRRGAGEAVPFVGVFVAAHRAVVASGDWPGVSTVGPVMTAPLSALPAGAQQGDAVTVGATVYRVRDVQPDGTGLARLILEKE